MRYRDMQSDRPTGRYERRTDAWLLRDGGGGSALPWLLGIAANVLADTIMRNRIEASARQRMGLPLDLATEDGYVEVEDRLSPCVALERQLRRLPEHELEAVELRVLEDAIGRDLASTPPRRRRSACGSEPWCSPRPSSRPSSW